MIEIKTMFTEKSDALRIIEQAHKAEHEHLNTYQDGYSEGFSDGWDKAISNVQIILKRYSIGGEKSDLKPVAKGIRPAEFYGQIEKIKEEIAEVVEAWNDGQGRGALQRNWRIYSRLAKRRWQCLGLVSWSGRTCEKRYC